MKELGRKNCSWKIERMCSGRGWDQNGKSPCRTLWQVEEDDIQFRIHKDYGGGSETYYGFTCPTCGCFTEIDTKDIPHFVKCHAKLFLNINVNNPLD